MSPLEQLAALGVVFDAGVDAGEGGADVYSCSITTGDGVTYATRSTLDAAVIAAMHGAGLPFKEPTAPTVPQKTLTPLQACVELCEQARLDERTRIVSMLRRWAARDAGSDPHTSEVQRVIADAVEDCDHHQSRGRPFVSLEADEAEAT